MKIGHEYTILKNKNKRDKKHKKTSKHKEETTEIKLLEG